ncbi:hypothetical protein QJS66_07545 [Kocuria rhizophila]|nr:hypothetical protein QJS66_07545 [Kocuria rhizophila]
MATAQRRRWRHGPAAGADGAGALAGGTGVGTGGIEAALETTPAVPGRTPPGWGFTAAVEPPRELWQVHGCSCSTSRAAAATAPHPRVPRREIPHGDSDAPPAPPGSPRRTRPNLGPVDFWISAEQLRRGGGPGW